MAETNSLLNCRTGKLVPGVRIPLSPHLPAKAYAGLIFLGEMAEWSNAAVSKTVVRRKMDRGFESPSLRNPNKIYPSKKGFFISLQSVENLFS